MTPSTDAPNADSPMLPTMMMINRNRFTFPCAIASAKYLPKQKNHKKNMTTNTDDPNNNDPDAANDDAASPDSLILDSSLKFKVYPKSMV